MSFDLKRKHMIVPLKIMGTVCLGRYSGYLSFHLCNEKHPTKSSEGAVDNFSLPLSAFVGGACCVTTTFICKSKHQLRETKWFLLGLVPLGLALSQPLVRYSLRETSEANWYRYKKIRALVAFGAFGMSVLFMSFKKH